MAAVLADASYFRIGFSLCLAVRVRRVRVSGGSAFHLEQYTLAGTLLGSPVFDTVQISRKLHSFLFLLEGGGDV